jgi:hypothetical protein
MPGVMRMGMVRKIHGGAVAGPAPIDPDAVSGLQGWWEADAIVGLNDGDPVATWEDSHTSNHDLVQPTGAQKPTYKTSIQNGLPVVRFDGTDDNIAIANGILSAAPLSALAVVIPSSVTGTARIWSSQRYGHGRTGATALFTTFAVLDYTGPASSFAVGTPTIASLVFDASFDATFYKDGGSGTTVTHNADGSQAATSFAVGARANITEFFGGDIAELAVYNTALSDADREGVRAYLNAKWAVY